MPNRPVVYHIPVCPFCQRLKILLDHKGLGDTIDYVVVDITQPRDSVLLTKTGGSTALPVMELPDGRILKESLVILDYLDAVSGERRLRRTDPYEAAVEAMLIAKEGPFTMTGYLFVMNQDPVGRDKHLNKMLEQYRDLDRFLSAHAPDRDFLFDAFGLAEAVFTPMFMRFWFLEYYEGFKMPDTDDFVRVRRWRDACLAHPAAQQVTREEIIKFYYDYALGYGNGAVPEGRKMSSFAFKPDWQDRPWPPKDKFGPSATDAELGLV